MLLDKAPPLAYSINTVPQSHFTIREIPPGDRELREFVKFPWCLHRGDPCWTPPLNGDLLGNRLLGLKGLLNPRHPYHRHSEVTHFMAYRGSEPQGRISAAINHEYNEYHNTSLGFFGFFDVVEDYEAARQMLDTARDWISRRGMAVMRGPGEYSNATHERQGILIDGFEHQPVVELTHNFPYYQRFLEDYGMQKAKDYLAFLFDRSSYQVDVISRLARKVSQLSSLTTRPLEFSRLKEEVRLIVSIYNEAWADNWGFLPISPEEGDALADTLRMIIVPQMVHFACVDGEPAAVMGVIPDPNWALRPRWKWYGDSDLVRVARLIKMRRHIPRLRGMFFGVRPGFRNIGIPALLAERIMEHVLPRHYQECDGSLILEDNEQMLRIIELFGGRYYKKWRIYDLPLK